MACGPIFGISYLSHCGYVVKSAVCISKGEFLKASPVILEHIKKIFSLIIRQKHLIIIVIKEFLT